ncbi:hypothetical protein RQP46_004521 [Phenoliferia psychrophenolica]
MLTEAIVVRELNGAWGLEEINVVDECGPSECLIAIAASGFCHSDLSMMNGTLPGPFPAVLGHEGSGTVLKVGSEVKGAKCLLSWAFCQTCTQCSDGHQIFCEKTFELNSMMARSCGTPAFSSKDGTPIASSFLGQSCFARHCLVDESSVIVVPATTSKEQLELLSVLGCGQITGAGAVLNILKPKQGSTIAVFGIGAVGAAAVMGAALCPVSKIIAIDLKDNRLDLAKKCGATHVINASAGDVVEQIKALTGGKGVDYAVECAGVVKVLQQAYNALAPQGTVAAIGIPKWDAEVSINVLDLIRFGKKIVGAIEGDCNPKQLVPFLAELHANGKFPFDILCKKYPFSQIEEAVAAMKDGSVIKPVLVWD